MINCSAHTDNDDLFASVYLVDVNGFTMEGMSIQNGSGIVGVNESEVSIAGCSFLYLQPSALQLFMLSTLSDVVVYNTTFVSCSTAVKASASSAVIDLVGCALIGCTLAGNDVGLQLSEHIHARIESTLFVSCSTSAINASESSVDVFGCMLVGNNCEVLISAGSKYVVIEGSTFIGGNNSILAYNRSAITVDSCTFLNNGYAMQLYDYSTCIVSSSTFSNNINAGYFEYSNVNYSNCSFEGSNDSSIAAVFTKVHFTGDIHFVNNSSPDYGGALYLHGSTIYLSEPVSMVFENNTAALSGGVAYSDSTLTVLSYQPCILQFVDTNGTLQNPNIHMHFANNKAYESGSILYGSLYGCILNRSLIPFYDANASPIEIIYKLSSLQGLQNNISMLAADPTLVCLCTNGPYQCQSSQSKPILLFVYPGQQLTLSLTTIDEYSNSTPAVVFAVSNSTIIFALRTTTKCSNYTIPNINNQQVMLITEGKFLAHWDVLWLSFQSRPCPSGFMLDYDTQKCECISILHLNGVHCFITNQTILKPLESWIGVVGNGSVAFSPLCPGDKCNVSTAFVELSSNSTVDMQCINAHVGILCGGCQEGLSLTLGSSQCRECASNYYLFLLVVFAVLGVTLVALLFLFNLTVSVGTINGIIFYANIINTNSNVIFQNSSTNGLTKFLSIFISWINLDFGIETCFYNGLDSYDHAWLQFAFPMYIVLLIIAIILAGRFSNRVSRWCRHNAVSAMATLLLLLYTKILQNVAGIFSFTVLSMDNNSFYRFRWLPDPNVEYLNGKHIPLFIAGVVMTIVYIIPLTAVLLFTPCLQKMSHWKPLLWVNKLKPFLDSYQAPYKDLYRFWTGALLLVRFVLYTFVTISTSTVANLLAVVVAILFPLVCILGLGVYKKWSLTMFEGFLYSNAIVLTILVYLQSNGVNVDNVVLLGIGSVFCCFTGIIAYNIVLTTKVITCLNKWKGRRGSYSPIMVKHEKETSQVVFGLRNEFIN